MKKKIAAAICMILIGTSLAACGGSSANESNTEEKGKQESKEDVLTVEFFQQKTEEAAQVGYNQIIEKFNEANPDIKIEMNTVPDAPTVLTSRVASGDIPTIFTDFPTQVQFKQKVANGYVQDLSDQEFLKNVEQSALDMTIQEDGKYYALPFSRNYMGVWYNIDIFKENNLEIPKTWDEFINVCETLKSKGITPLGLHGKDPGRVGHTFQCCTVAWDPEGVETIEKAVSGEGKMEGDEGFTAVAEKMLTLFDYSNEDALAMSDMQCYENFANGKYAMCITGSYARGTIMIANPDLNLGIFPLPNDTYETTNTLSGIDAAICVSAKASEEEKEAAYRFLEFLAQPENAQLFCDAEGAPACIKGVKHKDEGVRPMLDLIADGQVHDWMASTIDNNVITDLYSVTQGFWSEKNVENYLKEMDKSIAITSAE